MRGFGKTMSIAAMIAEEVFDRLDAPVVGLGMENVPIPFSKAQEQLVLSDPSRLAGSVAELVGGH